jgi:hypothetical protein
MADAVLPAARPDLLDPHHLLRGSGTRVRHVRLESAKSLDSRAVRALIEQALAGAAVPIDPHAQRRLVIRFRLTASAAAPPHVNEDWRALCFSLASPVRVWTITPNG